jgi:hypothetical protein
MKWQNRIAEGLSPGLGPSEDRPESTSNPAHAGCNSDRAQYSSTPSLRSPGFEDDDDEDENEAPQEWRPNDRPLLCPTC